MIISINWVQKALVVCVCVCVYLFLQLHSVCARIERVEINLVGGFSIQCNELKDWWRNWKYMWGGKYGPAWWLSGKGSACSAGDMGWIAGSRRSPGGEHAAHSSTIAWRIPWTEGPGEPMWSQRVRHDWSRWAHTHVKEKM